MKETVHAGMHVAEGKYMIRCTEQAVDFHHTHRYRVATNGHVPPLLFTGTIEEITCYKCLEWARAREVVKHVKEQADHRMDPFTMLTGHSLDMFGAALGATRYSGETDNDFRQRMRDSIG